MESVFELTNGLIIKSSKLRKISNDFFELLKKELPEEALTHECICLVIDSIQEELKTKNIIL